MSKPIWEQVLEAPLFVIVSSRVQSSETTWPDKSPICNLSTHKPKSSKTSEVDSTSFMKDCVPYWTDFLEGISSQLLLPVNTDCADLEESLYSTFSSKTVETSWFETRLYCKVYCPQSELTQDLLSIVHVNSSRMQDWRKYGKKIKEDPNLPKS